VETWLNFIGLVLTGVGAGLAAWNVMLKPEQAKALSGTYWDDIKRCTTRYWRRAVVLATVFGSSSPEPRCRLQRSCSRGWSDRRRCEQRPTGKGDSNACEAK
jgi:hypothetical protein